MTEKLIAMTFAAFGLSMLPMALTERAIESSFLHVLLGVMLIVLTFIKFLNKPSKLERIHARSR